MIPFKMFATAEIADKVSRRESGLCGGLGLYREFGSGIRFGPGGSFVLYLGSLLFLLVNTFQSPAFAQQATDATARLDSIIKKVQSFEPYDKKAFPLGRFEVQLEQEKAEFAERQLKRLDSVSEDTLSETEAISLQLLRFVLQNRIDAYTYRMYLNPVQADQGLHLDLNYRIKPILSYGDARAYLNVLNAIPDYTEQQMGLIRIGLEEGISQPKIIFEGYESTYDQHIVSDFSESPFYAPFEKLPAGMDAYQKDSVLLAAKKAIRTNVVPSFKKII